MHDRRHADTPESSAESTPDSTAESGGTNADSFIEILSGGKVLLFWKNGQPQPLPSNPLGRNAPHWQFAVMNGMAKRTLPSPRQTTTGSSTTGSTSAVGVGGGAPSNRYRTIGIRFPNGHTFWPWVEPQDLRPAPSRGTSSVFYLHVSWI